MGDDLFDKALRACGLNALGENPPAEAIENTVKEVKALRESGKLEGEPLAEFELRAKEAWWTAGLDGDDLWERAGDGTDQANEADPNQKQVLVGLLDEDAELFSDERDRAYARIRQKDHFEIWPLRGRRLRAYLSRKFHERTGNVPSGTLLSDALNVLLGMAFFDGETRELANRFCWHEGNLYYDLADEDWRAVQVTPAGWRVVPNPPPLFRRYSHQLPQVEPVRGGDLRSLLEPFVNVASEDALLLVLVWLVAALLPDVARTVLILWGAQGSAKTTLAKLLRRVIDPSAVPMPRTPRNDKELAQALDHHAAPFFDNLSFVDARTSDTLCRAVTGDGFTKRQLYTDDDDVLYQFQRVILLNGINVPAQRPDLLDRSILIHLNRIPKESRLEERDLWRRFEEVRPKVFGAVLTALSGAMGNVDQVQLTELPRMADWTRWGAAIAEELGFEREDFLSAYAANRKAHHAEALTSHPVGQAVLAFMRKRESWEGAPSKLLEKLEYVAMSEKIDTRDELWPGSASWLTRRIREVETNLNAEGIQFAQGSRTSDVRTVRLWREAGDPEGPGGRQGELALREEGAREDVTDVTRVTSRVHGDASADEPVDGAEGSVQRRRQPTGEPGSGVTVPSTVASPSEAAVHGRPDDGDAGDDGLGGFPAAGVGSSRVQALYRLVELSREDRHAWLGAQFGPCRRSDPVVAVSGRVVVKGTLP